MSWPLSDAKNRFSEVVDKALHEGPQRVSRRGADVVVVVSIDEYQKLQKPRISFKKFLMSGPSFEGLDLERDPSCAREFEW